ncbi:unnamed protein product [Spirodela intermedia]|uniref:Uncharacterized protein n=1 Tax=Spirodela intermedia TaxID=51605 RepID=A0A7I8ID24_SPIIN|nr:unnamed protein product [Spirodela intermedia]CAA6655521.1 unnamed protein product [Spirodela intermedia]
MMEEGGNIVDYHGCDFFPSAGLTALLSSKLTTPGYTGLKLTNNIECEIFQVLLEEAKGSYRGDIVMAMKSDSVEDISRNVSTLTGWVNSWAPARLSS